MKYHKDLLLDYPQPMPLTDTGPQIRMASDQSGRLWVLAFAVFHALNTDTDSWVPEEASASLAMLDGDRYVPVAFVRRQKLYRCWTDIFEGWHRVLRTGHPPTLRAWEWVRRGA